MADESIPQQLRRIEARLEGIERDLTHLAEMHAEQLAEHRKTRDELRLLVGLVNSLATTGQALTEYVQALSTRVDRLERP